MYVVAFEAAEGVPETTPDAAFIDKPLGKAGLMLNTGSVAKLFGLRPKELENATQVDAVSFGLEMFEVKAAGKETSADEGVTDVFEIAMLSISKYGVF